jgi:hypothetical protein
MPRVSVKAYQGWILIAVRVIALIFYSSL